MGPGAGAGTAPRPPTPNNGLTQKKGPGSRQLSPEDQKRRQLLSKLHPSIAGLIERLKNKNAKPTADESKFVRDGKVEIQLWLSVKNPQAIAFLKRIGFEVVLDPPTSKLVMGRIPIEKLAALAESRRREGAALGRSDPRTHAHDLPQGRSFGLQRDRPLGPWNRVGVWSAR